MRLGRISFAQNCLQLCTVNPIQTLCFRPELRQIVQEAISSLARRLLLDVVVVSGEGGICRVLNSFSDANIRYFKHLG